MYEEALDNFKQIERILEQNEQDTARARQELKQDCFIRAKACLLYTSMGRGRSIAQRPFHRYDSSQPSTVLSTPDPPKSAQTQTPAVCISGR